MLSVRSIPALIERTAGDRCCRRGCHGNRAQGTQDEGSKLWGEFHVGRVMHANVASDQGDRSQRPFVAAEGRLQPEEPCGRHDHLERGAAVRYVTPPLSRRMKRAGHSDRDGASQCASHPLSAHPAHRRGAACVAPLLTVVEARIETGGSPRHIVRGRDRNVIDPT